MNTPPPPRALKLGTDIRPCCHSCRKWLRFSEKGGIGKAVSIADRLAESGTDELMFMEGDAITVLMQLGRCS